LKIAFADGGFRGNRLQENVPLEVRVVSRPMNENQFCVIEKRWVVERTIAWIQASRRLVKDYERKAENALAYMKLAAINLMVNRI